MPNLTIITGDHKTGKTTRARQVARSAERGTPAYIFDEADLHLIHISSDGESLSSLLNRGIEVALVINVPEGTPVIHEHLVPSTEPEREYRLTGWPGCDVFHPQSESEARFMLNREIKAMERFRKAYRANNDFAGIEEMNRRIRNAGYESRVVTDWEAGK